MKEEASENPIYVSPGTSDSLGQEYRIFSERIELRFRLLFTTYRIPINKVVSIDVVPPAFSSLSDYIRGRYPFMAWIWCLMLDKAAFRKHVLLVRSSRGLKYFHFTPENPEEFVAKCRAQMNARKKQGG